ncbi:M28 family peptidase [archaeon]|jgi:hypothetical protein|nr:M28 family peptidase [archaeon]MBT3731174.1 M28 family peptidase [archaeon]MBT4670072.1 M28 family peptidase [archaeon]MBT5030628.1 M28 family peptidase [archaeon]MBT5287980.1 M28 family peptidase [archaeon]
MSNIYPILKGLVGAPTEKRFNFIESHLKKLGMDPSVYELDSQRGKDKHISVKFDYGSDQELWLTANYDTFQKLPSANNNASGVTTLLDLSERLLQGGDLPINLRLIFFDAGLDTDLITQRKRNPGFIAGSKYFLDHMLNEEIDFIENYVGAIILQALGKGNLCTFQKTGKKNENSSELNKLLRLSGDSFGDTVELKGQSPLTDNISFLREGLDATVLARYHEGSWHRMQTKKDDLSNINPNVIHSTVDFLHNLLISYGGKE